MRARYLLGLILLILGIGYLLEQLAFIKSFGAVLAIWWPLLIVLVGLNQLMEQSGLQGERKEELIGLLTRQLTPKDLVECMKNTPPEINKALLDLQAMTDLLEIQGYGSYIHIDLSTLRNQEYYTGMVFEIYTSGIGYPIGGGGRYDRLLEVFGRKLPATGFALGVERLLMS
jgi:ATP phosphoribosyltransferase regulatory subunit